MEQSYSCSKLVGYSDHVENTTWVKLPLKYGSESSFASAPNDAFNSAIASNGNLIKLNSVVDNLSWTVSHDLKWISLCPVVSNDVNFDMKFHNLNFQLPNPIINSKCLSINYQQTEDNQGTIIIDFIDINYLFITLTVSPSDFIVSTTNKFSLDTFRNWGNISVPYSFELRSVPFSLVSVDPLNLVVSLNDGGLLHFKRPSILSDFDVYNFNDTAHLLHFGLLDSLFKRNNSANTVVEGINSNSIIDVVSVSNELIITLTVSKQLKIWNLVNHQLVSSPISLCDVADNSWLTAAPAKHLRVVENEKTGVKYLTLFYTSSSKDDKSAFQISAWEIDTTNNIQLNKTGGDFHLDLPTKLYDNSEDQFQNSNWFIQDFETEVYDDFFLYHILWKSNTSSVLTTYQLNLTGGIELLYSSFTSPFQNSEEFSPYHDADFYRGKILNSGRYNELIITTSLNILKTHYGIAQDVDNKGSIRDLIQETIYKTGRDSKLMWFKLYSLCEEYKKLSEEVLGLSSLGAESYLATQVNGFEIFRPSHYYEKIFFPNSIDSPELKIANILRKITTSVSIKTCYKLNAKVRSIPRVTIDDATELYNIYLKSKFSEIEVQAIINEISSIPDAYKILNSLVQPINVEMVEIVDNYKYSETNDLSPLKKLSTIAAIKGIKEQHEGILSTLLVLFLLFEVSDDIVNYINDIIEKLNNYNMFTLVLETSFKSLSADAHIEDVKLNNPEYSLFWSAVVNKHPLLNKFIRENSINEAFNYIYSEILSSYEGFIVDVIIDLINRGEGKFIRETFFNKLNETRPIDKFLMGLVYLINGEAQEFFNIFEDYEYFNVHKDNNLKDKFENSLTVNPHIKNFLDTIFAVQDNEIIRKSDYYNALSELAKSQIGYSNKKYNNMYSTTQRLLTLANTNLTQTETNYLNIALNFQQIAIQLLTQLHDANLSDKIDSYYLNVFELSLRLSDYASVYDALSNLSSRKQTDLYDYRELFTRFIRNLIINQSISMIFPPNTNQLYLNNYLLIDDILLTLANNENNLSASRKLYEYVYSWRLFGVSNNLSSDQLADKRGAIEALYMFINRFRDHSTNLLEAASSRIIIDDVKQFKLKILELYMIIINCLKSFENDDDKWLIKRNQSSNIIVKLDDIRVEYFEWIKELEKELHEL